jgi:hypothetical protein
MCARSCVRAPTALVPCEWVWEGVAEYSVDTGSLFL